MYGTVTLEAGGFCVDDDRAAMVQDFLDRTGTTMRATFVEHAPFFDDEDEPRSIWRVTIRRGRRGFSILFGQSIVASEQGLPPDAATVLACLPHDDPGSLEDFIDAYGSLPADEMTVREYRRLERAWKLTRRQWRQIERVFGTDCDLSEFDSF